MTVTMGEDTMSRHVLDDGSRVLIRPMREDDETRLVSFHELLSSESQRLRFFSPHPHLTPTEIVRFTHVDGVARVALVAERGDEIVAVARFDRPADADEAEVAFVVRDDLQGHGLGTLLLQQLANVAREHGIERLTAETLIENRKMIAVFRRFGAGVSSQISDGVVHVVIPL